MLHITPETARKMILEDRISTEDFFVDGDLNISNQKHLIALPDNFCGAWGLNLEGCTQLKQLPNNLDVKRLNINDCVSLTSLPAGLISYEVQAQRSGLIAIPDGITVDYRLDLRGCHDLIQLPENLNVGSLIIAGCVSLESLPDGLSLYFLDASGCVNLKQWGATGNIEVGNINLSDCGLLTYLPEWMGKIARLNISGCANLHMLPETLQITSTIEFADSGLRSLPEASKMVTIRWRGVEIDERIAFHQEDISAQEVINEQNIERRRIMLERIGYEAFFKQANAQEVDRDFDPGGLRRLLRVEFNDGNRWEQDEPLVCLSMSCPSTARKYVIRVPPAMKTCHQAAAWIAGFDDPDDYYPDVET